MSDQYQPDEGAEQPPLFAPSSPPFRAHPPPAPPAPGPSLFEPAPVPSAVDPGGAPPPDPPPAPPFVSFLGPSGPAPPLPAIEPASSGNAGWVLSTVALVAVFVAVVVAVTVLWDARRDRGTVDTSLSVPAPSAPPTSAGATPTEPPSPASSAPATTEPAPTTTTATGATGGGWLPFTPPDGSYTALFPSPPRVETANVGGIERTTAQAAGPGGATLRIVSQAFPESSDPGFLDLGLDAGVREGMPAGVTATTSAPRDVTGGRAMDFTASTTTSSITGRAVVGGGRRHLVIVESPAGVNSGELTTATGQFLDGFTLG